MESFGTVFAEWVRVRVRVGVRLGGFGGDGRGYDPFKIFQSVLSKIDLPESG